MNEQTNYVITHMAAERGITFGQMQVIIEEALHARFISADSVIRKEMLSRFGGMGPSAEEFIEEIAKLITAAHQDE